MTDSASPIRWFRDSSPYINAHRNKTFVVVLSESSLTGPNIGNIVTDLALLQSLGIKLVIVLGDEGMMADLPVRHADRAIVRPEDLDACKAAIGRMSTDLKARFSVGLINSPMHGADITVVSGNFVRARPLGIIDGVDHHNTGETRRVNKGAILGQLAQGAVVLLPPIGYSPTGETFILDGNALAQQAAIAIGASKLIYYVDAPGVLDGAGSLVSELQANQVDDRDGPFTASPFSHLLAFTAEACRRGVSRCHLISESEDGALLVELFTRDGTGTQVVLQSYESLRDATVDDVAAILALIEPLQLEGVLVARSRELIESEIDRFIVIERDGLIIGCAALYPFAGAGELACLAIHPDYRNGDRGERLLAAIEHRARGLELAQLFALSTKTSAWFQEHGFRSGEITELPAERQSALDTARNSRLLVKTL